MAQSVCLGRRLLMNVHKLCSTPTSGTRPFMAVGRRAISSAVSAQNWLRPQPEPRFSFQGQKIFDSINSKSYSGARAFSSSSGDSFDDPVEFWDQLAWAVFVEASVWYLKLSFWGCCNFMKSYRLSHVAAGLVVGPGVAPFFSKSNT